MSDDLMPFGAPSDRSNKPANRGPYPSPHWMTQAGQIDRRNEATHVVAVRDVMRRAELATLETAAKLKHDMDEADAAARLVTEQKYLLHRAQKETQILGGDDPDLRAKFQVLDDDLFSLYRRMGIERRS